MTAKEGGERNEGRKNVSNRPLLVLLGSIFVTAAKIF